MNHTLSRDSLRTALIGVCGVFMAHGLSVAVLAALFPVIKAQLAADDRAFAFCLTALGLGALAAMAFSGPVVSRFGSARVALGTAATCAALFVAVSFSRSLPAAAATLFVYGAASGITDIAMNVQASLIEQRSRANYMTRIHGFWSIGGILGSVVAGAVIERLPPLTYTLMFAAFHVLLVSFATSAFLPDTPGPARQAKSWSLPPLVLLPLAAMAFLSVLCTGGIRDWSAIYLHKDLGSSLGLAVQGFAAFSGATAVGRFGGDAIRNRIGNRPLLVIGGLAGGLAMAAGLAGGSVAGMLAAIAGLGFAHSNLFPVLISASAKSVPGRESRNVSAVMAVSYGGYIVGPMLIGLAANAYGLTIGLGLVAAASLLIAAAGLAARA